MSSPVERSPQGRRAARAMDDVVCSRAEYAQRVRSVDKVNDIDVLRHMLAYLFLAGLSTTRDVFVF